MEQFEILVDKFKEIKELLQKKGDGESDDEEPNSALAAVLADPDATEDDKYDAIRRALPVPNNVVLMQILDTKDGRGCLFWILQLGLNKAVAEEGASYDTTSPSSALASKVMHMLFSIDYVKRFKIYDPRENYTQQDGTAMQRDVFEWLQESLTAIASEFYKNFNLESSFDWKQFLSKFREVWRWTRSNNSDTRRERRRKQRKGKD